MNVTPERLLEILNEKLRESGECDELEFQKPPMRYADGVFDGSGCNWSPFLILTGPADYCLPDAWDAVAWARDLYNLVPESEEDRAQS